MLCLARHYQTSPAETHNTTSMHKAKLQSSYFIFLTLSEKSSATCATIASACLPPIPTASPHLPVLSLIALSKYSQLVSSGLDHLANHRSQGATCRVRVCTKLQRSTSWQEPRLAEARGWIGPFLSGPRPMLGRSGQRWMAWKISRLRAMTEQWTLYATG